MPTPGLVTSQIVLMNSHGVAMASDSAVTYGDDRTFERVNKIFHMGGDHEISFIISGNAILLKTHIANVINIPKYSAGFINLKLLIPLRLY